MSLELFGHPFSSYTQKALLAFEENGIPFTYRKLGPEDPEAGKRWKQLWPLERFPVLVDGDRTIVEATAIIEYLHATRPGPVTLLPSDPLVAVDVRMLDRFFDNYVSTPQQAIVFDSLRNEEDRDPFGVAQQRAMLDKAYAWLDERMAGRTWAVGGAFSMADCAAAPALFYADWTHRIDPKFANVLGYRERLLARPSFAKLVDDARPFRAFFPLGAPDRD
jgi:glutathione S-transferase